ncbi:MAG: bifunctional proline dehydrogenase/L-glutamate gamma-semialdehyde dehydrogenase [Desulfobacteraceae bacterium]|nr:bifunctional proline dehydrogenase/L-glutamate gamma-semialdehyde dehydrogenase [Desulfobacteraceae bacterium]
MGHDFHAGIADEAIELAALWLDKANASLTAEEKKYHERMQRLLNRPGDKIVLTRMIDQSFRSNSTRRIADQINYTLRKHGVPDFLSETEKLLTHMFLGVGRHLPGVSVPKIIDRIRQDARRSIVSGDAEHLSEYVVSRREKGVRVNINRLGEAILGEDEAGARLKINTADLENPAVDHISIKISTLYSQINPLAHEHTVKVLVDRLSALYRAALRNPYPAGDNRRLPKFINLDMEAYTDLHLTVDAFMRTLDQPEFLDYSAGIVLQAYLPDAFTLQQHLTKWARKREERGHAPIKIRIVKGANMEMERLEARLNNWPLAPFDNKRDVDANYKRMVSFGMRHENIPAVRLGVASHNLFELAYAWKLAEASDVREYFTFEMLEGMANHVYRALVAYGCPVLLYAPVADEHEFINAVAYLIRRLDENTTPENYLRHAGGLKPGKPAWEMLKSRFLSSIDHMGNLTGQVHRRQNRFTEIYAEADGSFHSHGFENEPNTDWSLEANRIWAEAIRKKWRKSPDAPPLQIPLVIAGGESFSDRTIKKCMDPSQFSERVCVARYAVGTEADVEGAVRTAKADPDNWRTKTPAQRHEILGRVAVEVRKARGDLIGAAAAHTGKVFAEADVEVSEAIDFLEYYPYSVRQFENIRTLDIRGKGVGVVVSPWNFPIAIPCGGIAAALAAGNTVIFKPASNAVLPAWLLCQAFWRAGVSRNALQFLSCSGDGAGKDLVTHPDVDFVILTGGTETGLSMLRAKADMMLSAETGGKNTTIVTAMSDRDQAIDHVIDSAFGNGGQKCSATSLLILEREVFDDPHFKTRLVDAAKSLHVGSAWDFKNKYGPLIRPPAGDLERALTRLEPGEFWALAPKNIAGNPHLWAPGIKWNVQPGSYTHTTEFFGPVLGVMCAEDLEAAVDLANDTGYGLTAGIESLDPREVEGWEKRIFAGNLYVNRGTTGAIVLRQPFGGRGRSVLGPGLKAGSPNYVIQFMDAADRGYPEIGVIPENHPLLRLSNDWQYKAEAGGFENISDDILKTVRAIKSYLYHFQREFGVDNDYFHIGGQDNILRYLPMERVIVRIHPTDTLFEVLARIAAVRVTGAEVVVSMSPDTRDPVAGFLESPDGMHLAGRGRMERHTDKELAGLLGQVNRVRYAGPDRVPREIRTHSSRRGIYIADAPVLMEGRVELLYYLVNQNICNNYHRYGNLGERGLAADT